MKIDVTIATKDNAYTIEKVIKSIKKNIPYNEIILVDDSTDNTPKLAEALGAKVYRIEGRLGLKRTMQAKLSTTEWIACIDSDVVIYPNWWKEIKSHLSDEFVGSISGFLESDFKTVFPEYENFTKYCALFRYRFVKRIGAFSNILVNREALLQCENVLKDVHAGEDNIIGRYLKKLGYKHYLLKEIVGFHWHKDAVMHHIMAFHRAGESVRMKQGLQLGLILSCKFLTLQTFQLILFCIIKRKVNARLWQFVGYLSSLFLSGVIQSSRCRAMIEEKLNSTFISDSQKHERL